MAWSVENIDGHLPGYMWESFATYHVAAGILVGTLFLALSYPVFHQVYLRKSARYRDQLTRDQQIVVIHHSVQALTLSLLFVPFTYVVLSVNFEEQNVETLGKKFTALATFMSVIIVMYLIEIASRFVNLRALVVAHHLCAYMNGIVTAYFLDTANVKSASLLVYFITYEAATFMGLVMYRLVPDHKWTRPMIVTGMVTFGLSRPIQLIWIIAGLIEIWSDAILWQAIFQIVLATMFTSLQIYSLTIHYSLYKKLGERQLSMPVYVEGKEPGKPAMTDETGATLEPPEEDFDSSEDSEDGLRRDLLTTAERDEFEDDAEQASLVNRCSVLVKDLDHGSEHSKEFFS